MRGVDTNIVLRIFDRTDARQSSAVERLIAEAASSKDLLLNPIVLSDYLGEAYAIPTRGGQAAFTLLARSEAVLTDSVYSAKALHAVVDRAGRADGPVVFWHTGGIPALFSDTAGITDWHDLDATTSPIHH